MTQREMHGPEVAPRRWQRALAGFAAAVAFVAVGVVMMLTQTAGDTAVAQGIEAGDVALIAQTLPADAPCRADEKPQPPFVAPETMKPEAVDEDPQPPFVAPETMKPEDADAVVVPAPRKPGDASRCPAPKVAAYAAK